MGKPGDLSEDMMPETEQPITISLPVDLGGELAKLARERQTSEAELAARAIRHFVRAQSLPPAPRFARRLGPILDD